MDCNIYTEDHLNKLLKDVSSLRKNIEICKYYSEDLNLFVNLEVQTRVFNFKVFCHVINKYFYENQISLVFTKVILHIQKMSNLQILTPFEVHTQAQLLLSKDKTFLIFFKVVQIVPLWRYLDKKSFLSKIYFQKCSIVYVLQNITYEKTP